MIKNITVQKTTNMAFLVALEIILARFCSISTPLVRIGFSFLPISLLAMLYGPLISTSGYAAADFIGAMLFPIGTYFPGFTLTAFLAGGIYGLVLYKHKSSWLRALTAAVLVCVLQLGLDTFWLSIITGKGMLVLLPMRILKSLVMIPIITMGIQLMSTRLFTIAKKYA